MSNKFLNIISKIIIVTSIIGILLFAFNIFSNAEETDSLQDKNREEISYLDTKILSIINSLNNIELQNYKLVLTKVENEESASNTSKENEQSSNKQADSKEGDTDKTETKLSKMEEETIVTNTDEIDWETIEGELEVLSSTWSSIIIDLNKANISSEDILNFGNDLNDAIGNVKKQDKTLSCMYLAKLYGYLPKFLVEEDEIQKETLNAKANIINAYAYAENENWNKMYTEISKAESIFANIVNDVEYVNDTRKYNINKAYILIGELKNSISSKDTGIFYLKYKNALEGLNILT